MKTTTISVKFQLKSASGREVFLKDLEKFATRNNIEMELVRRGPKGGKGPSKELQILQCLEEPDSLEIPTYAPADFTQRGIADRVGLDPSVVSRYLSRLKSEKLVRVRTLSIISEGRRKKVYFLTASGKELLAKLKNSK